MPGDFSKEFDLILREFIKVKQQDDKPFTLKNNGTYIMNESLFKVIDTNGKEGLQLDEIEAFFNSFKLEKEDAKKYYNGYMKFADTHKIDYPTNATSISFAYNNLKNYVEMEVKKSKYPKDSDLTYKENDALVYTSQFNNDIKSYLNNQNKSNSSTKITYQYLLNRLIKQDLTDYKERLFSGYKNFKFPKAEELNKLFDKLNKDGNKELDASELAQFFLNLKGGDENNVNFKIDDNVIKKFKELSGIADSDNIPDGAIVIMFDLLQRIIFDKVIYDLSPDSNMYISSNFEQNIGKLKSDISFDTQDEKFKKILSSFDIGTSDNPSQVGDGKLSPDEIRNLWNKIKTECAEQTNGMVKFNKSKVEAYIKKNFPDNNITLDDFISFINVIDLSLKNSYINPNQKIDYDKSGITEPNVEIDAPFNQYGEGDCWFISTLVAMSTTEQGKELLNNCLRKDNNGNVYVNLKGPKETYVITAKELADEKYKSQGDGDARAIELAVKKYFEKRNNVSTLTGGNSLIAFWLVTGLNYRDKLGENYYVEEPCLDSDGNIYKFESEVDEKTKKPKKDENGQTIYKLDENGNKIPIQNKFLRNFKNEDLDRIDFSKQAVTAASNKGTKEKAIGYKADGTKVEFPQNHSIAVVGVDSEYVYIVDQNDIDAKTGSIDSAKIKFTREVFNNFFTRLSVFSYDKNQPFSYTPNKEKPLLKNQKFQTEHTPENEEIFRKFVGGSLEYSDSDRLKTYGYDFSETDMKIISKFPDYCKSQLRNISPNKITRAEIKWFFEQLKRGKTNSSEIIFDDKTYNRMRKKLGITESDNISNEDILKFYNSLMTLMTQIVNIRKG